jgi:hypothetical protein
VTGGTRDIPGVKNYVIFQKKLERIETYEYFCQKAKRMVSLPTIIGDILYAISSLEERWI